MSTISESSGEISPKKVKSAPPSRNDEAFRDGLVYKIDKSLTPPVILDISTQLSGALTQNIDPKMHQEFLNILGKNFSSEFISSYNESLKSVDIAQVITLIVCIGLLMASGVGIVAALGVVSARIGASAIALRIATMIASRPNFLSVVFGLIPGMKMAALNQGLALGVSEMRNFLLFIAPNLAVGAYKKVTSN